STLSARVPYEVLSTVPGRSRASDTTSSNVMPRRDLRAGRERLIGNFRGMRRIPSPERIKAYAQRVIYFNRLNPCDATRFRYVLLATPPLIRFVSTVRRFAVRRRSSVEVDGTQTPEEPACSARHAVAVSSERLEAPPPSSGSRRRFIVRLSTAIQ